MRFTLISFIGILSSLQGCTKETPVPQLQSQATTDLDASPSSPTISSAPNSLRSSHQPKSAPNTSNSANIEESVNESSHIVSSTNKSSDDVDSVHHNDVVDTTVHSRFNLEVGDMSEQLTNGITDETVQTAELEQRRAEIMRRMNIIRRLSPQETPRDSLDTEIQFVRDTIDAANRFTAEIGRLQATGDVSYLNIELGSLFTAHVTLNYLEQRLRVRLT